MKLSLNILVYFFMVTLSINSIAQENPLLGDWKVVAVDNGEFYFNSERNSIVLTEELKSRYSDSSRVEQLKKMAKMIYIEMTFSFSEDGQFLQKNQIQPLNSFYKIDPKSSKIYIYESGLQQDSPDFSITYTLKDNRLFLEIPITEPPTKFELVR